MFDIYTLSRGGQHLSKTLTLFNTKVCNFQKPYIDLIVPDQKFDTLGEGCTRAKSVCLTKNMVTPMSKIWTNLSVNQKDQRCHSVWVGQADFSEIAQRKQKIIKRVNCVFILEN